MVRDRIRGCRVTEDREVSISGRNDVRRYIGPGEDRYRVRRVVPRWVIR